MKFLDQKQLAHGHICKELPSTNHLNCPSAVWPRDIIHGKQNDPYAVGPLLGWHTNGPVKCKGNGVVHCNRIQIHKTSAAEEAKGNIVAKKSINEQLTPKVVEQMF